MKKRTVLHGTNSLILLLVFLGILTFINMIVFRHKQQYDFTATGFYTLSPQTKIIVETLPREVKLTAFFQTGSPEKSSFQDRMQALIESSDKLSLSFIDPDKNPTITKKFGITTYSTIVLESGKKETQVKDPSEANLVNGILKVIKDEQKVIRFLEGHGEKRISDEENQGLSAVKESLEKDGFQVENLLLLQAGEIPADTKLLVIPGPEKPIAPEEQKIIEDYLNAGGSVLLLLDPQSKFGMEELLKRWSIDVPDSFVIDPMSKMFGGDYAAPVISQYIVHDITREFVLPTIFPLLRMVKAEKVDGVEATEFLQTGSSSWAETNLIALNEGKSQFDEQADFKGPVPVAVISTREIPAHEPKQNSADDNANIFTDTSKNTRQARLVVIGDSDFVGNKYFNFSGNGDLFLNTTSFLAEEKNLISIRPKERKNTPLSLTQSQGLFILMLGVFTPALVVLMGIRTWWRRRSL